MSEERKYIESELLLNVRVPSGMWRNFNGAVYKYVKGQRPKMIAPTGGPRYFNAFLSKEQGIDLKEKGWNVQWTTPREEGDEPQPYIKVNIGFNGRFPIHIFMIQGRKKEELTESKIGLLEGGDFIKVDIRVSPYVHPSSENGASAWIQNGYFTRRTDPLAEMYAEYEEDINAGPCSDEEPIPWN